MVQGFHEQWEESNEEEENEEAEKKEAEILNGDGLTELADSEQPSAEGPSANGADSKAPSQGEGDDEGERKISNSIGGDKMSIPGTEDGNNDENTEEKETYLPGSINSNPSIGKFYTSTALDGMLHGEIIDEVFLHEFLDLIPTTLSTLSLTSRESPGRRKKDADKRTPHQLGTLAVQSIYSSSRMAADAANAMVAAEGSGIIVAPKMTDKVEEMAKQYLGSDLPIEAFPCLKGLQGENMENVDPEIVPSCEETSVIKNSNVTEDREADVHGDIRESQAEETTAPQDDYSKAAGGTHESTLAAAASETKEILGAKRDENDGVAPTGVQLDAMDSTFAKMLENLPSAECLSKLNFAEFKSKMSASRKPAGGAGTAQSAGTMEPIFKKLTDEIKSLQTNLSIQEQFTKTSVACYQRVLLDSIIEIERIRTDQGDRLARLESAFQTSWSGRFLNVWRWFVHVVSSTIPQTWRWLFSSISATFLWTYSSLTVVHSWACSWLSTLVDFWLRVSRIALRLLLQFWPTLKNTLLSGGSATWFTTKFSPVAIHIDQLVERLSSHLSSHYQEEDFEPAWWAVPFVITVTVIFFCRLIMFCTSLMTRRGGSMSQDRRKLANQKQHEEQINPLVRQEREMAITQKQDEEHIPPLVDDETLSTMTKRGGSIRQDRRKLVNQKQHEEQINLLTRQEREMVITQKQDEQLIYPHS